MDLIAKVACRGCPAAIEFTVLSAEHAAEELEAAGWTERSGGDGHLCPACSKPPVEPKSMKPSDHAWSTVQIASLLREGGFVHEAGGDIWREGPDFCWIEAMRRQEWVEGAELCVRVHYAVGQAKRESDHCAYTASDRLHHREGLGRLTSYLAEKGFRASEDARGGEKTHLIVYRMAGHERDELAGPRT